MREVAVIRRIGDRLAWYPPGAADGPHWLDNDDERAALSAVIAQRQLTPIFAVPGEDTRLLRLPVAAEERRHLEKSLPYMLEEEIAEDVGALHFARVALDKDEFAVAVCARELMDDYRALLDPFPPVNQWLPEPLLLPWQPGEWCLVLEGERAIVRHGRCEGFAVERDLLPAMLQALAGTGDGPEAVIVYGEQQDADLALLPAELAGRAQWRRGDFYAAMLVAENPEPALNLRQGSFALRLPLDRWWRLWRAAAILFGVAVGVHLLASWADLHQLEEQNLALRGALEKSYRQVIPRGMVPRPEQQLQRQLDELSGGGGGSNFVGLLARVGSVVQANPGSSLVSINYNDKAAEMRLNILAKDYAAVERIRAGFADGGLQAVLENSSASGDQVRARLRVGGRS
ncbi:type II secretion system protein GspL [Mangrovimicrobium sediminis]|uniref:Type II secretion system protein L n=1 Tax=Mangrovimicrobium sediminis TaxID=2562682 RepID=A0A4Z0M2W1_9GAMM|nr:type II secretion system protein GspL [Haliea sp. SAOS-164]TGD74023.1 type II secretion system protein GspL [Haliea sp. SAOS-164]